MSRYFPGVGPDLGFIYEGEKIVASRSDQRQWVGKCQVNSGGSGSAKSCDPKKTDGARNHNSEEKYRQTSPHPWDGTRVNEDVSTTKIIPRGYHLHPNFYFSYLKSTERCSAGTLNPLHSQGYARTPCSNAASGAKHFQ